jgi:Flp pilus assembly protein TadD
MTSKRRLPETAGVPFPTGGQLLGFLVDVLQLRQVVEGRLGKLKPRQLALYFAGGSDGRQPVSPEMALRIHRAIAETLVAAQLIPVWEAGDDQAHAPADRIAEFVGHLAEFADRVFSLLCARGAWCPEPRLIYLAVLRLAAVEFGARVGGLLVLEGWPSPEDPPSWADEHGSARPLCELLEAARLDRVSHAELARIVSKRLGGESPVHRATVAKWVAGTERPEVERFLALAEVLAKGAGLSADQVQRRLQWHWALSDLCQRLAASIGREDVHRLATTCCRTARVTRERIEALIEPGPRRRFIAEMWLVGGLERKRRTPIAEALVSAEPDPLLQNAMIWALHRDDWMELIEYAARRFRRLGYVIRLVRSRDEDTAELEHLARMVTDELFMPPPDDALEAIGEETRIERLLLMSDHGLAYGRPDIAIAAARRAARLSPLDPGVQLMLGTCLRRFGRPEEALAPLAMAVVLDPSAPLPRVEMAKTKIKLEQLDEAVADMERACRELREPSAPVLEALAFARARKGELSGAVEALELCVRIDPHNGTALALLAGCCSKLGLRRKAKTYATRAARLGWKEALLEYEMDHGTKRSVQSD